MKRKYISIILFLTTFLFGSHALAATDGTINITGELIAPACALTVEGGDIDFGEVISTNIATWNDTYGDVNAVSRLKRATVHVTDCLLKYKKAYITVTGAMSSFDTQAYANSSGSGNAENIGFRLFAKYNAEMNKISTRGSTCSRGFCLGDHNEYNVFDSNNKANYRADGYMTNTNNFLLNLDDKGAATVYLDALMVFKSGAEPTIGAINVPLTVTLITG